MRKMTLYILMVVMGLMIVLSGCGGGTTPAPSGSYSLSPTSSNLMAIGSQTVNFSFTTNQGSGYSCTWSATASDGSPMNGTEAAFSWTTPTYTAPKDYKVTAKVFKGGATVETKNWTVSVCKSVDIPVTVLTTDNSLPPSKPLAGVTVEIFGVGLEYKGVSDNNGKVTLSHVPAGDYFLRCSEAGYITTYEHVMSDIASNCTLDIKPTVVTWSTCNAMLGVTMGSVQDTMVKSFAKLTGAMVTISPDAGTVSYLSENQTTSNLGVYCFYNLPAQNYTLTAALDSYTFNSVTLDLTKFSEAALYFPDQFTAQ